jgi:hypothetical protein
MTQKSNYRLLDPSAYRLRMTQEKSSICMRQNTDTSVEKVLTHFVKVRGKSIQGFFRASRNELIMLEYYFEQLAMYPGSRKTSIVSAIEPRPSPLF